MRGILAALAAALLFGVGGSGSRRCRGASPRRRPAPSSPARPARKSRFIDVSELARRRHPSGPAGRRRAAHQRQRPARGPVFRPHAGPARPATQHCWSRRSTPTSGYDARACKRARSGRAPSAAARADDRDAGRRRRDPRHRLDDDRRRRQDLADRARRQESNCRTNSASVDGRRGRRRGGHHRPGADARSSSSIPTTASRCCSICRCATAWLDAGLAALQARHAAASGRGSPTFRRRPHRGGMADARRGGAFLDGRQVRPPTPPNRRAASMTPPQNARLDLIDAMIAGSEKRYADAAALFGAAPHLDARRRAMAQYGGYFARSWPIRTISNSRRACEAAGPTPRSRRPGPPVFCRHSGGDRYHQPGRDSVIPTIRRCRLPRPARPADRRPRADGGGDRARARARSRPSDRAGGARPTGPRSKATSKALSPT